MSKSSKLLSAGVTALVLGATSFGFGSTALAASCYQYDANGFPTSSTPVFNNICGVPGYGNESDFVRIRQSTGDATSTSNNAAYTSQLANACVTGTKFDVHTYIHNDAESQLNDNGNGSAVAKNVALAMIAKPVGQNANQFNFASTISASNAATVSDGATLNCQGQPVKLTIVASSAKIYGADAYGWTGLPSVTSTSIQNGTPFSLGNPAIGSGTVYGCWNYRMTVVYQVEVTNTTKPNKPSHPQIPQTPTSLPSTGPTDLIGIVAGASVIGAFGYRLYAARKSAR